MRKLAVLLLSLTCVLLGCSSNSIAFDMEEAEKLTVVSGTTGEIVDITNKNDIRYITENIHALQYSKGKKVEGSGWSYELRWFSGDGTLIDEVILLGDGYTIIYDAHYYRGMSIDQCIDLKFLEAQFME